jgi:hypothetical protein
MGLPCADIREWPTWMEAFEAANKPSAPGAEGEDAPGGE